MARKKKAAPDLDRLREQAELVREHIAQLEEDYQDAARRADRCRNACEFSGHEIELRRQRDNALYSGNACRKTRSNSYIR